MEHQSEPIFHAVNDPLLREFDLPYSEIFHPHGIPLRLRTNSTEILRAAHQSFGSFERLSDTSPLELHVGIAGSAAGEPPPAPIVRTRKHILTVAGDAEHFGICDFESGFGYCWLTPRVLADLYATRYFYLDTLALSLVTERYLVGVHGACVAWKGRAVLLCGNSHAGKSTLAYACARRGFTYISDDGSFLVRAAGDRIVSGNPHSIRFRPSASELFPELRDFVAFQRPNGKPTIEVATSLLSLPKIAARAKVHCLVFLNRQPGSPVELLHFSRDIALTQLEQSLCYGRDSSIREQRRSLELLLDGDLYELIYSDLDAAIDRLQHLLEAD